MIDIDKSNYQNIHDQLKLKYIAKTGKDNFEKIWQPFIKYSDSDFTKYIPLVIKTFDKYEIEDDFCSWIMSDGMDLSYCLDNDVLKIKRIFINEDEQNVLIVTHINGTPIKSIINNIKKMYDGLDNRAIEKILVSKKMLNYFNIADNECNIIMHDNNKNYQYDIFKSREENACNATEIFLKQHDETQISSDYSTIEEKDYYLGENAKEDLAFDAMHKSLKILSEMAMSQSDKAKLNKIFEDFTSNSNINSKCDSFLDAMLLSTLILANNNVYSGKESARYMKIYQKMARRYPYDFVVTSVLKNQSNNAFLNLDLKNNTKARFVNGGCLAGINKLPVSDINNLKNKINDSNNVICYLDAQAAGTTCTDQFSRIKKILESLNKEYLDKDKIVILANATKQQFNKFINTYKDINVINYPCTKEEFNKQLDAIIFKLASEHYDNKVLPSFELADYKDKYFENLDSYERKIQDKIDIQKNKMESNKLYALYIKAINMITNNKTKDKHNYNESILTNDGHYNQFDPYKFIPKLRHALAHGHYNVNYDGSIRVYSFKKGNFLMDMDISIPQSAVKDIVLYLNQFHNYDNIFPNIYPHKDAKTIEFAASGKPMANEEDIRLFLQNMSIIGVHDVKTIVNDDKISTDFTSRINNTLNRHLHVDPQGIDTIREIVEKDKCVKAKLVEKRIDKDDENYIINGIENFKTDFYKLSYSHQYDVIKKIILSQYSVTNDNMIKCAPSNKNIANQLYNLLECPDKYDGGIKRILDEKATSFIEYNDIAKAMLLTYFNSSIVYPFYDKNMEANKGLDGIIDYSTLNFDTSRILFTDKGNSSKEIMTHLRNSIAHGNYEFVNGLDSNNILNSEIHFLDIDDRSKNGKLTFDATYKIGDIIEQTQNTEYQQSLHKYYNAMMPKTKEKILKKSN